MISMIVAIDKNNGIGYMNKLPWPFMKEDMVWFKEHTINKTIVMGSNTWNSLPTKPLKNRHNVVLSSKLVVGADSTMYGDPLDIASQLNYDFVLIGGKKIYMDFFPLVERVILTRIDGEYLQDTFLSIDQMMGSSFALTHQEVNNATFEIWERNETILR